GERGQAPASGRSQSPARAPFKILETYIKHYPVEYHAQSAVEAAQVVREELLNKEGRSALSGIDEIEIGSYDVAIEIIGRDPEKWRPATRETADHRLPYCVAAALLDGTVTVQCVDATRLTDPQLPPLTPKVRVLPPEVFLGWHPKWPH